MYISWGKGGRCVGLTTLPPSCADSLEIWEPDPPGTLKVCPGTWYEEYIMICFSALCWFKIWNVTIHGVNITNSLLLDILSVYMKFVE